MPLAHRIQLSPTNKQIEYFKGACGTSRFVWNWALAEWNKQDETGEKPNASKLKKQFNSVKYKQFPWLKEIHRDSHARPFTNLASAWSRFFSDLKSSTSKKSSAPTFKKKGQHDSFYVSNDKLRIEPGQMRLPVIGWVKLTEDLRLTGKIMSATVSRTADKWFVSVTVEGDFKQERVGNETIGVDLGISSALTTSNGEKIKSPKPLKKYLKNLKRKSKRLSKKQKGSKNREKAKMRLAKLHLKITNIRKDFLHKETTKICRENQTIVLEDLNVKGMMKNHCLARAISDIGFSEFRRQIEYKSKIYGNQIIIADRWFPSSKICSRCGVKKEKLKLSERIFCCESCGLKIARDLNAALNLQALGLRVSACGQESSGFSARERETNLDEAGISKCAKLAHSGK